MIKLRHQQPSLWTASLAAQIEDLWEPWMQRADELLEDEQLLDAIYEAQGQRLHRERWFRQGQRWRTGCEGRISVLKRRHGLRRSLYRGFDGMQRWVGLGVIADNLIQIGRHLALQGT